MAEEVMMVPTTDYNNLVNYYKGRLTESALLNKAGRLAAERHVTLNSPHLNKSVAVAMSKTKARELNRLTKRIRTGGRTNSKTVTGGKEDDDDDDAMLVSPLEHKLDKILRATKKTLKPQPQRSLVPQTKRRLLPKIIIIIIIIIHLYSVFSQWSKNASQKGNYNYKLPMTIKNKI